MWHTKKLNEVCDIQSGLWKGKKGPYTTALVLRNTNFTASGVFDYSNVVELEVEAKQLANREVIKNDIILEKSGGGDKTPVGRVCIHDKESKIPFSLSNFTARIRVLDSKELNAEFLHKFLYFLYISGKTEPMQRHSTGIRNLQLNQYKDIDVPLPPLQEQERIVAKLDAAFDEINESIKNINLKVSKLDKFKSAIISDSYRGNGWDYEKLGDCVSYEKNNAKGSSLPYVGMQNIAPETMDLVGEIVIPEKTSSTFHFNKSHVLFRRLRPYLRKVLLPDFEGQCSTEIFCIKPKDKVIREFLAYWLLEQKISSKIEATSTGARMPRANMNALLEFDFPIPSTKEQKKIISKIDLIFTRISEAKNTLAKSKKNYFALKSAILSQELQSSEAA